jgi:hypothetical protein
MEKEARQKELRLKDRDAQQARVCPILIVSSLRTTLLWPFDTFTLFMQFSTDSRP